jgi:PAS domain S-box-containing protein
LVAVSPSLSTLARELPQATDKALREAVAGHDGGIWEWDVRTDDLWWSPRIYAMLGLDPAAESLRSGRFFDRLHPEDRIALTESQRRHGDSRTPHVMQYRLRHADGRWLWFDSRGQAVFDAGGRVLRMIGFMREITEEVATRRALEDSEARFSDLVRSMPGVVLRYRLRRDGSDILEYVSPGCREVFGIAPEAAEADAAALWATLHPEDLAEVRAGVARSSETLQAWEHRFRIIAADGATRWLEAHGAPSRGPDGAVTWNTVVFDVTEKVAASEALARSERRFADIAASVPGLIYRYTLTADGRHVIDYVGPQCREVWRLEPEAVLRDCACIWDRLHPDDLEPMRDSVARSAADLTEWRARYRVRLPDGRLRTIAGRGTPRREPDGATVWNSVAFDITEAAETEAAVAAALETAQAANHAKSMFLATMSHEIRTPMNGVSGMAALLAATELDDRQRKMVEVLQSSSAALLEIVNTVLDFSRMDVSGVEIAAEPFDLRRLAEDVAALAAARVDPSRVKVSLAFDPDIPAIVIGDANKLRQILVNLTSNAAKFTEEGSIVLGVAREAAGAMAMTVRDTGPGVPADQLAAIFEPFTQADQSPTRRHGGAGLGLSIARRIARAMGGTLTARSTPGCGSAFTLTVALPEPDQPRTETEAG